MIAVHRSDNVHALRGSEDGLQHDAPASVVINLASATLQNTVTRAATLGRAVRSLGCPISTRI
jgi:hypothetical protein